MKIPGNRLGSHLNIQQFLPSVLIRSAAINLESGFESRNGDAYVRALTRERIFFISGESSRAPFFSCDGTAIGIQSFADSELLQSIKICREMIEPFRNWEIGAPAYG